MSSVSIGRLLKPGWMLPVAVTVVAVARSCVYRLTALPWSYDVTTTEPAVFANITAHGETANAYTFCLDKSG